MAQSHTHKRMGAYRDVCGRVDSRGKSQGSRGQSIKQSQMSAVIHLEWITHCYHMTGCLQLRRMSMQHTSLAMMRGWCLSISLGMGERCARFSQDL